MTDVAQVMLAQGERLAVGANTPVELDSDTAWLVTTGTVDMFVRQSTRAGPGKRHLVSSLQSGSVIWLGSRPEPESWGALLVGRPGTELCRLPVETLAQFVDQGAFAAELEALVDAARRGDGREDRRAVPADGGEQNGADRLSHAREQIGELLTTTIHRAIAEEEAHANRIATGPSLTRRRLDAALTDLVEIVDRREPLTSATEEDQLAQLDGALDRIGRELGVDFPGASGLLDDADPVSSRISNAGCRKRTVTLGANWWSSAGSPLLGFIADSGRPVALIPRRAAYLLFDPVTVTETKVTPELASSLAPRAYTIYPGLPADGSSASALLRSVLTQSRGTIRTIFLLGALAGLIAIVTPIVTALVYGSVLPQHDRPLLIAVSALLVGAAITWGLVILSQNLATLRFSGITELRLDPAVIDRVLQLPSEFFRRYDTGDLATRAGGLQLIRQQISGAVISSLLVVIFSVFSVGIMFAYSVPLAALALAILIVSMIVLVRLNVRAVRHQHQVYFHNGEIASDLFQVIQGINKLRVAGAEQRFMTRWAATYRRQAIETYGAGRSQAWIVALIGALPATLAFALYALTIVALKGTVSGSDFVALMTALGGFTAGLVGVALVVGPLLSAIPLWQRLRPILEEPLERQGTLNPGVISGRIELRDVTFGYDPDAPPMLANLSVDIAPGEFVAITGPSGAGKSTLLRLLLGLDTPTSGTILYDGKDLAALDARKLRSQIGVVMQGARPLPGEVIATIMGTAPPDESKAWAAAEAAELAEDIRLMPMGMHTLIGDGGLAFSGGQLQRLMIARALARSPKIMFFDEATSALDDRTQERVSERLQALDATRVVIAHRLSTIRKADRIYVLEAGRIVQAGTFDELIKAEGLFQRLALRQLV